MFTAYEFYFVQAFVLDVLKYVGGVALVFIFLITLVESRDE